MVTWYTKCGVLGLVRERVLERERERESLRESGKDSEYEIESDRDRDVIVMVTNWQRVTTGSVQK